MSVAKSIRILPDALINKIAAGEVVERPASAVKELVENAVDSGARQIRVEVRSGGKTFIGVRDDGSGMGRDDALTAIERHATSKIASPQDLFSIHTLGFRGEALPSIAQISRMEIFTATRGAAAGTHLFLDGGVLKDVRDAPPIPGTEVQVRRLFFNTPVRLRFLKGERTELGHVTEAVSRIALARKDVGFELFNGAAQLMETAATPDLGKRVGDVLGASIHDKLVPVDAREGGVRLHGLVGLPSLSRSSRTALYLFVNGRPVRDKVLLGAVLAAYRNLIPWGRFPVVVLFLELPAGEVDHNVHPTKNEVRFVHAGRIRGFLVTSIEDALQTASMMTGPAIEIDESLLAPKFNPGAQPGKPTPTPDPQPSSSGRATPSWSTVRESLFDGVTDPALPSSTPSQPLPAVRSPQATTAPPRPAAPVQEGFRFAEMTYLGAYEGTYLLFQDRSNLILLDQHAAHERINYERILAAGSSNTESQRLLVPEVLDFPRSQAELLLARADLLASLGIEITEYGGASVAVTAVPPAIDNAMVRQLVHDVAQELLDTHRGTAVDDLRHRIAALAACHVSVRAHDRLSLESVNALLKQLDDADLPFTCPHGRPILIRFTLADVKKWFERS